jgi:hypothetical protein
MVHPHMQQFGAAAASVDRCGWVWCVMGDERKLSCQGLDQIRDTRRRLVTGDWQTRCGAQ